MAVCLQINITSQRIEKESCVFVCVCVCVCEREREREKKVSCTSLLVKFSHLFLGKQISQGKHILAITKWATIDIYVIKRKHK